jgi:hypothetical protein
MVCSRYLLVVGLGQYHNGRTALIQSDGDGKAVIYRSLPVHRQHMA